ncbi:MAG: site-specific DNA-methyltransferase [Spirochaetia bacterium]|jgi:adenine-specific DNA-methyltransferase
MAKASKKASGKSVHTYTHEGKKRKNNPPVGLVSTSTDKLNGRTRYQHDPHIDPILSWAGKAEGISFEVQNVSLHIHERIDPYRIIQSFLKPKKEPQQLSLFLEPENEPPLAQAIDFYKHDQDWTNRLIAGDSLLVMNSLLVKEGMAGKVQMIYMDPPYGIKYNSNFQPFVNKRDVKDGNDGDIPAEPEMIQAFRDTWELGIHSYLTYLRDRLLLAHELLSDSGSVFLQISDENLHHVRELMDEVFGEENFICTIAFKKTGALTSKKISVVTDHLLWYARQSEQIRFRQLYVDRGETDGGLEPFRYVLLENGEVTTLSQLGNPRELPKGARACQSVSLTSQHFSETRSKPFMFRGKTFSPPTNRQWSVSFEGLERLAQLNRIFPVGDNLRFAYLLEDNPTTPLTNIWVDTGSGSFTEQQQYVVETAPKVIERCVLMTTDTGDLVLDPTCGSGTTAFVAEKWGRRWITCDTSRVALTLAKQRLMTAKYDYYKLSHSKEGIKSGFEYITIPHITLKSIANDEPPQEETLYDKPFKDMSKIRVTGPFTFEAVPSLRVKPFDGKTPKIELIGSDFSRVGETNKQSEWIDELKASGIRAIGGKVITFSSVEPTTAYRYIHAIADIIEKGNVSKKSLISFGPDYGALDRRQVQSAIDEARKAKDKPDFVIFAAFQFDPEASKDIDLMEWKGVTILKAQMSVDLFTADLRKKRSSNQSYWLIGQPDVELSKRKDGKYTVKLHGFDYYDPLKGEIISKGTKNVAMWFLDIDYDDRSIIPNQVFFPEGDEKRDWTRLAKALKTEINEDALEAFSGVVSLPFSPGDNRRIAVKIIDNRGIESFVIKELE